MDCTTVSSLLAELHADCNLRLCYLQGATATLSDYLVKKAYFTMVANPTEFRKFVPLIAEDDEAGYAAFEAEMASKSEAMRA